MRVESDSDTLPVQHPIARAAGSDGAFANALAAARNPLDPELLAWTDKPTAGEVPPAEEWGQYGQGATALGYGPAPDPSQFINVPTGPEAPASPLNPSGVSTTPSFIVPGYTARGTPIPPGFYNITYYNLYLQEGGTPLEGFPQLVDGATLTETYGKYGDGAERAIAFSPVRAAAATALPGTLPRPIRLPPPRRSLARSAARQTPRRPATLRRRPPRRPPHIR